jgi:hypothetical protein
LYANNHDGEKVSVRAGAIVTSSNMRPPPDWLEASMHHKAVSGNQAVYSYRVVEQLVTNPRIKQLFALAKYGCCCCLEERTWIAAMDMLGLAEQAKAQYSMYQLWGGMQPKENGVMECSKGGMKNAVLEWNHQFHSKGSIKCFRSENAYYKNETTQSSGFMDSTEVWEDLVRAKERGTLFARKFRSDNPRSMELLNRIVRDLHKK